MNSPHRRPASESAPSPTIPRRPGSGLLRRFAALSFALGAMAAGTSAALPPVDLTEVNPTALRLAIEDLIATHGDQYPQGAEYRRRWEALQQQSERAGADRSTLRQPWTDLAREALLANPLLDFDRILLLQRRTRAPARKAEGGSLGIGTSNWSTSDTLAREKEFEDSLSVLSQLRGTPTLARVYRPPGRETLVDPVLHFDADRVLFAMNGASEKNWRLWEIRLGESTARQVTPDHGQDVAHFDGCYLPDDRILFASTAAYQGLPCLFGSDAMTCLYLFDPATRRTRQLTFEQDSDWCPTLLPNGRVLYQRWEYTDQSHANSRMLFHMNPDGTDQREFRGSGSWFPGSFFYAKPIPGSVTQVIGIAGGHHDVARAGRLLLLDTAQGRRDAEGIVQEIPRRGQPVVPVVRDGLVRDTQLYPQFLTPSPLSAKYHLVAAKPTADSLWGIYLVDTFDNVTLLAESEGEALLWPTPLRAQPRPPVLRDRVDPERDTSDVLVADVYAGPGLAGVPRGTAKQLRVIEYYFSKRGMGGLYGSLGADGPWDIKRILGTVPVEEDGSAHFTMPANTPVCVQPLDAQGQALQLERSWFVGMPGERVSCIGCHESPHAAAPGRAALALRRAPTTIEPWFGPARGFAFVREVQPVLDRHCVSCHDGTTDHGRPGPGQEMPDLRGGRMLADWNTQMPGRWEGGGKFTTSYWELQRFVRRPGIEGDRRMFTPLDYHFSTTELGQLLRKGHHDVHLDAEAHQRLAAWVDLNAPFYGTWGELSTVTNGSKQLQCDQIARASTRAAELRREFVPSGPFPDYEQVPELPRYDATPIPRPADTAATRRSIPAPSAELKDLPHVLPGGTPGSVVRLPLAPGVDLELVRLPGGEFLMGSSDGHPDESPVVRTAVRPFWMARLETSNRQFRSFDAAHESRTEDRHGYQFGITGHDQDQPAQPAVRVSWEEALAFCDWLTKKTGLRLTLPTEAQWEWACRAGTRTPFHHGGHDSDFAPHANLGDAMLARFGGDPYVQDHGAAAFKNPNRYDNSIPQDARFNDGGFVTEPVGRYRANAWGLHDLHGNAAEWTRSAYRPYPYREDDGRNEIGALPRSTERVVRGGSWRDRPFRATASYRLPYAQYQRVFNVGFRVVCEESDDAITTRTARLAP
ncbi:MAG: SUMF1/EgtB/PvdO family nonheme iron enzyme [Verrucomicrobiales bacterium]|nr:SUMF1/EgtB/PvdO family nonheme iron enzyme [Verrucomicrobiales bacterium]